MHNRKPQIEDKYVLRFPDGMRDRLKEEAAKNGRSLNAEIIQRLSESLTAINCVTDFSKPSLIEGVRIPLPPDLVEAIQKAAEKQKRSIEGQAISTLDAAYMHLKR